MKNILWVSAFFLLGSSAFSLTRDDFGLFGVTREQIAERQMQKEDFAVFCSLPAMEDTSNIPFYTQTVALDCSARRQPLRVLREVPTSQIASEKMKADQLGQFLCKVSDGNRDFPVGVSEIIFDLPTDRPTPNSTDWTWDGATQTYFKWCIPMGEETTISPARPAPVTIRRPVYSSAPTQIYQPSRSSFRGSAGCSSGG